MIYIAFGGNIEFYKLDIHRAWECVGGGFQFSNCTFHLPRARGDEEVKRHPHFDD